MRFISVILAVILIICAMWMQLGEAEQKYLSLKHPHGWCSQETENRLNGKFSY